MLAAEPAPNAGKQFRELMEALPESIQPLVLVAFLKQQPMESRRWYIARIRQEEDILPAFCDMLERIIVGGET